MPKAEAESKVSHEERRQGDEHTVAERIHYTVVNGEVLLGKGAHTGRHPSRVLHNALHQGRL